MSFFDLRPYGLIKMLDLIQPIYRETAAYGHFGREQFLGKKSGSSRRFTCCGRFKIIGLNFFSLKGLYWKGNKVSCCLSWFRLLPSWGAKGQQQEPDNNH